MKYRSLSLSGFEAVQVDLEHFDPIKSHRWRRKQPEWIQDMMDTGHIEVYAKDGFISLTNENATFKCFHGDYIVKNRKGLVFWMPRDLFEESFKPDDGGKYGLTHKQQAVLDYIISCDDTPTIREIMEDMGYKSTSVVKRHLDGLKERGYINTIPGRARGIKVL